jgi:hypothetical protein
MRRDISEILHIDVLYTHLKIVVCDFYQKSMDCAILYRWTRAGKEPEYGYR